MAQETAKPCVRCGYCCKTAPCPYGRWDHDERKCAYLVRTGTDGEHACSIHDRIRKDPSSLLSPAFGQGCGSTLFNADRERVLRSLADGNRLYDTAPAGGEKAPPGGRRLDDR